MIPIAVDAMGGDFAPRNIVEGACQAIDTLPDIGTVFLVGDQDQVNSELLRLGKSGHPQIEVVHSDQIVGMTESPASAIRSKPRSSIAMAVDLVKKGQAQAVVSAGHTGAAVASSVIKLRPLPGIERPAIATVFPSTNGRFLILDAGASIDCRSKHLAQFAVMGEMYAKYILQIERPRVGLLNLGEEPSKGNEQLKEAHALLSEMQEKCKNFTFVGNVEGNNMFNGVCDILVCDGLIGNVALKCTEGTVRFISTFLKQYLRKTFIRRLGALLSRNAFRDLKAVADHSEYGGAPLLGINGVCIIGHGSSCPNSVANAIRVACESVEQEIGQHILDRMQELQIGNGQN